MARLAFLAVSCGLALQLHADPITFTLTSLTGAISLDSGYSLSGSGYDASGDSITVNLHGGSQDTPFVGFLGPQVDFQLDCFFSGYPCFQENAFANVGGHTFGVTFGPINPGGSIFVTGSSDVNCAPPNGCLIPGLQSTGEYVAYCLGDPNCPSGTLFGDVFIDLPGDVDVSYRLFEDQYVVSLVQFTSTPVPEPGSAFLAATSLTVSIMFRLKLRSSGRCRTLRG